MKVLCLFLIQDEGPELQDVYSNVDSAWDDFVDLVQYAGGDEEELEVQKKDLADGAEVSRWDGDVSIYLEWYEVKS